MEESNKSFWVAKRRKGGKIVKLKAFKNIFITSQELVTKQKSKLKKAKSPKHTPPRTEQE